MQYISENLNPSSLKVVDYDYSDMFSMFKKKIDEVNESCVEETQLVSFCMEAMTNDIVYINELEALSMEELIEAMDMMDELFDIVYKGPSNAETIPLENIPKRLHKFFTVTKNIEFIKRIKSAKIAERKLTKRTKSKLMF